MCKTFHQVISAFCDTSDSQLGKITLKQVCSSVSNFCCYCV